MSLSRRSYHQDRWYGPDRRLGRKRKLRNCWPAAGTSPAGKPLLLAAENADIAAIARAENLFWCDVMMEHAAFFALLMPGADLAAQRAQAENFQRKFQAQNDVPRSAPMDHNNYAAFNRSTVELIKPFIDYKRRMLEAQAPARCGRSCFLSSSRTPPMRRKEPWRDCKSSRPEIRRSTIRRRWTSGLRE